MERSDKSIYGNRIVPWFLRGSLLLVAMFFMLFSFDMFSMGGTFFQKLEGFIMQNIFTLCILFVLYIAFKREQLAGFLLVVMSIGMILFFGPNGIRIGTWMMISLPFLVGILFLINCYLIKSRH